MSCVARGYRPRPRLLRLLLVCSYESLCCTRRRQRRGRPVAGCSGDLRYHADGAAGHQTAAPRGRPAVVGAQPGRVRQPQLARNAGRTGARRGHAAVPTLVVVGLGGRTGAELRLIARPDLPRHQARPDRQPAALLGPGDQFVEQRAAVRAGAESGLRLPLPARHVLPSGSPARAAGLDHPTTVVGTVIDRRLLGIAARRRGAGHRQPDVASRRRCGVRACRHGC